MKAKKKMPISAIVVQWSVDGGKWHDLGAQQGLRPPYMRVVVHIAKAGRYEIRLDPPAVVEVP